MIYCRTTYLACGLWLGVGLLCTGCVDEVTDVSAASGAFAVQAVDEGMTGGAFDGGTRYALWVLPEGDWSEPLVEEPAIGSDAGGRLENTHPNNFPSDAASLDFYALTWGTPTAPVYERRASDGAAVCRHERTADGTLPDLRRAARIGCTAANTGGRVGLPFKHTLVQLRYETFRQDEPSLEGARIVDIRVHDHASGVLDVQSGQYTYPADEPAEAYPVLPAALAAEGVPVTTTNTPLTDGGRPVETLVFPNAPDEYLSVSVTVRRADGTEFITRYDIPTAVPDANGGVVERPFPFEANHRYVLQLTILTDRVRIVAFVPQQYDWIDEPVTTPPVGNPITFAGATWFDRNLGAMGYDISSPESFNYSVGFFYQTCRNVPYWPFNWNDRSVHYEGGVPRADDRYKLLLSDLSGEATSWGNSRFRPYPLVSDRLWPHLNITSDQWRLWNGDGQYKAYMILEPEQAEALKQEKNGSYAFVTDQNLWWTRNADKAESYTRGPVAYAELWDDPMDQPVPVGWAIPTADQFRAIFPTTPFAGNVAFIRKGDNSRPSNWCPQPAFFPDSVRVIRQCVPYYRNGGEARRDFWTRFDGDIGCIPAGEAYEQGPGSGGNPGYEPAGDPAPGFHSVYLISREEGDVLDLRRYPVKNTAEKKISEVGTVYGIKKVGTPEAYRMRWRVCDVADAASSMPLLYVEVNMYSATADDNLTPDNYRDYDWEHPSATMNFPVSGLQDGKEKPVFCNYGSEVMYATSTVTPDNRTAVLRMKFWGYNDGNSTYMAVVNNELICHGKQIRMIRQ